MMMIRYDISLENWVSFNKYVVKKVNLWMLLTAVLLMVLLGLIIVWNSDSLAEAVIVPMVLIGVGGGMTAWVGHSQKKAIREAYKKNTPLLAKLSLTLDANTITQAGELQSTTSAYSTISKIVHYKDCFFIHQFEENRAAIIVPLSAFAEQSALDTFVGILQEKTGKVPERAK